MEGVVLSRFGEFANLVSVFLINFRVHVTIRIFVLLHPIFACLTAVLTIQVDLHIVLLPRFLLHKLILHEVLLHAELRLNLTHRVPGFVQAGCTVSSAQAERLSQ